MTELTWECSCGQIEYCNLPPEECSSCFKIDSFTQLPEELLVEREKDMAEEQLEMSLTEKKSAKSKVKKPGRKKKK
ncbi:MAG: hypothetical protein Q8L29_00330 [archaeon]|nr:hypothetical protein [archaeon]